MGKIILLDELTINQIAAGEVIERPASVVKELVENSIDAGAKNIVVEIKKGGIELIKITDDGSGIAEDDMEISFERHATSKIRSSVDLETVTSMGFRGEALASISAIANVEMISKTANDDIGHRIVVEGGEVKEKNEIGCKNGTTIIVQKLFYNTPVRYKFLRKDYTEAGYIEDVITRIALVNKDVAIKLINSGKTVIQTTGNNDMKSVVYSIYGKDIANGIINVNYEYEGIKLNGVVGKPEIARGNRSYQVFFVNGRYVKDKSLTSATDQAYKNILPMGKYGIIILNIEMDPKMVDVNVHPAKLEVRFENENLIFKAVYNAIKSVLNNVKPILESREEHYSIEEKKSFQPNFNPDLSSYGSYNKLQKKYNYEKIKNNDDNKENLNESRTIATNNEDYEKDDDSKKKFDVNSDKKEENKKSFSDIQPEEEIVQPKVRKGITGLIKKVMGGSESEREEYEENLVEALFEARNGKRRTTPDFENNFEENITPENPEKEFNFSSEIKEEKSPFNFVSEIKEEKDFFKLENEKNEIDNDIKKENEFNNTNVDNKKIEKEENEIEEDNINEVAVKIGNVSISSETKNLNMDDIIKQNEKLVENSKSDFKDTPKKIIDKKPDLKEKNDNISLEDEKKDIKINDQLKEDVKNIPHELDNDIDKLTESIVKNKIYNTIEPTQFVDTNKIKENLTELEKIKSEEVTPEFAEMYKKTFGKDIMKKTEEKVKTIEAYDDFLKSSDNLNVFDNDETYISEIKYRFVGNVFDSYFIIEMNNEMYIIDQKSAYEKIVYEKVKENYYNEVRRDSQMLLLPDIISLSKKEFLIAGENVEMFEKAGFGFEQFGENTIKLYAVPALCEKLNTKQLFIDILDGLDSVAITAKKEKEEKFLSTIAYKSSLKARINLDQNEIIEIINSLLKLKNPFIGSDNRQIAIKMTKLDFEKKFSRR